MLAFLLNLSKAISRKRCKIGGKLVLITNRKSYMSCRLVPKSVTLNDIERRNGPYFALFQQIRVRCRRKWLRSLSPLPMSFLLLFSRLKWNRRRFSVIESTTIERRSHVTSSADDVKPTVDTTSGEAQQHTSSSPKTSFKPRALLQLLKRPSLLISESARRKSLR